MTRPGMTRPPEIETFLDLRLTPIGHLRVESVAAAPPGRCPLPERTARRIATAFEKGSAEGLLLTCALGHPKKDGQCCKRLAVRMIGGLDFARGFCSSWEWSQAQRKKERKIVKALALA